MVCAIGLPASKRTAAVFKQSIRRMHCTVANTQEAGTFVDVAPASAAKGVTEAAGHLQTAGLIKYSRGHITVVDRPGLEARTCECYAVVKKESDRLLPKRIAS
jgi:hypothetical protein